MAEVRQQLQPLEVIVRHHGREIGHVSHEEGARVMTSDPIIWAEALGLVRPKKARKGRPDAPQAGPWQRITGAARKDVRQFANVQNLVETPGSDGRMNGDYQHFAFADASKVTDAHRTLAQAAAEVHAANMVTPDQVGATMARVELGRRVQLEAQTAAIATALKEGIIEGLAEQLGTKKGTKKEG